MNKYEERLLNEWIQHGKIIIACDFDDTLSPWGMKTEEDQRKYKDTFELLKNCKSTGSYVTIWSACTPDRYQFIDDYCKENGLVVDSINNNPIELPYGKHKKIYANIYLDDRAGLDEALTILSNCLYRYRGYLQELKTNEQNS